MPWIRPSRLAVLAFFWVALFLVAWPTFAAKPAAEPTAKPAAEPTAAPAEPGLRANYRDTAAAILGAALVDEEGYEKLTYLTTRIGHRLSGSPQLEAAIAWVHERMRAEGLQVRLQAVKVPHWVRGEESAWVTAPVQRRLAILGLGLSVGTPEGGIEAPVVVVESFEELAQLGRSQVEGKIVAYAVPWMGYGKTVAYRSQGASKAAELGAVAVLVRSATGHSLSTPHTGALRYDPALPKIPAAAMTVETSEWLKQMEKLGQEVKVRLVMGAKMLPDADSANLIAEIPGRELPNEVVVMGGHFDSWDVGHGAHDDGAPCMAAWQALRLIHRLGLQPRRTLRVVLWTNEENGVAGGKAYREALGGDVRQHVAAIEMDGGLERPIGFGLSLAGPNPHKPGSPYTLPADSQDPVFLAALRQLEDIAELFVGIEATQVNRDGGGVDIGPLMAEGVPGLSIDTVGEHYFDWHHSEADTLDKVEPQHFRRAVAILGVLGYVLADMPGTLVPPNWTPPVPAP